MRSLAHISDGWIPAKNADLPALGLLSSGWLYNAAEAQPQPGPVAFRQQSGGAFDGFAPHERKRRWDRPVPIEALESPTDVARRARTLAAAIGVAIDGREAAQLAATLGLSIEDDMDTEPK